MIGNIQSGWYWTLSSRWGNDVTLSANRLARKDNGSFMPWLFSVYNNNNSIGDMCSVENGEKRLTKIIVTTVNTRMVLVCLDVLSACSRPALASIMLACFCFRSRRVLIYISQSQSVRPKIISVKDWTRLTAICTLSASFCIIRISPSVLVGSLARRYWCVPALSFRGQFISSISNACSQTPFCSSNRYFSMLSSSRMSLISFKRRVSG